MGAMSDFRRRSEEETKFGAVTVPLKVAPANWAMHVLAADDDVYVMQALSGG